MGTSVIRCRYSSPHSQTCPTIDNGLTWLSVRVRGAFRYTTGPASPKTADKGTLPLHLHPDYYQDAVGSDENVRQRLALVRSGVASQSVLQSYATLILQDLSFIVVVDFPFLRRLVCLVPQHHLLRAFAYCLYKSCIHASLNVRKLQMGREEWQWYTAERFNSNP